MTDSSVTIDYSGPQAANRAYADALVKVDTVLNIGPKENRFSLFRPLLLIEACAEWYPAQHNMHCEPGQLQFAQGASLEIVGLDLASPVELGIFADRSIDSVVLLNQLPYMSKPVGQGVLAHLQRIARRQIIVSVGTPSLSESGLPNEAASEWTSEDFAEEDWLVIRRQDVEAHPSGMRPFYAIRNVAPSKVYPRAFSKRTLLISSFALPEGMDENRSDKEQCLESLLYDTLTDTDPTSFMISGRWGYGPYAAHTIYPPAILSSRRHPVQYFTLPGALNHTKEIIESQKFVSISKLSDNSPSIIHMAETFYKNVLQPNDIRYIVYLDNPNIGAYILIYLKEKYGINIRIFDFSDGTVPAGSLFTKNAESYSEALQPSSLVQFADCLTSCWKESEESTSAGEKSIPELSGYKESALSTEEVPDLPKVSNIVLSVSADTEQNGISCSNCSLKIAPPPKSSPEVIRIEGSFRLAGDGLKHYRLKLLRAIWDMENLTEVDLWGHSANSNTYSFVMNIGLIGMGRTPNIGIGLVLEDTYRVPPDTLVFGLGDLALERQPLLLPEIRNADSQSLRPLLISGLGRSGTTLLMKTVLAHPQIAGWNVHPYENQAAQYWLNAARILLQPADINRSVPVTGFQQAMNRIYRNPFLSEPFLKIDGADNPVREWVTRRHVPDIINLFRNQIDSYYRALARETGNGDPVFFAEKTQPNAHSEIFNEFYDNTCEVTIVRHPFDVLCSVRSFFETVEFYKSDTYIRALDVGYMRMLNRIEKNHPSNFIVRYEQLITEPEFVLGAICDHAGLERVVQPKPDLTPLASGHITAGSAEASLARWKQDLSARDQELCKQVFERTIRRLSKAVPGFDPGYPF